MGKGLSLHVGKGLSLHVGKGLSLHVGKGFSQHVDSKYKSSIAFIATIYLKGLFIRKGPLASLDELCTIEVR